MTTYEVLRQLISFDPKGNNMVQFFLIDSEGKEHIYDFDQIFHEECDGEGGWTSVRLKEIE